MVSLLARPRQLLVSGFCLLAILTLLPPSAIAAPPALAAAPPDTKPTLDFPQFAPGVPLRLVVYGDSRFTDPTVTSGTNPRIRHWLAGRIAAEHPGAVLLTGDTPLIGSNPADWQVFQSETKAWRDEKVLELPSTGNHEIRSDRVIGINNYLANFPSIAGHRYYSALLGTVEVISLDCTLTSAPSSPQGRWFTAQLDHVPPQIEFLLILYHMPWMADRQSQIFVGIPTPQALELRNTVESRLDRIHAKVLVFNGHIHNYERFERRGVEYVVTGGGGAEPYPVLFRGRADLYRDTAFPVYHYLTLDVSNHQLHAAMWKVKDPDAQTLSVEQKDEFTINAAPRSSAVRPR